MKKLMVLLLCLSIIFCLSACSDSESGGNPNGLSNTQSTKMIKKFSDEAELKKYAQSFWLCEKKTNDQTTFKICYFIDEAGLSWNFTYSSAETLEDCIKNVLKSGEEQGQSFRSSIKFLGSGSNGDGLEFNEFDIEYDVKNGKIISKNQTYGTFLNDGTLKCEGDIYKNDNELFKQFNSAFLMAKSALFEDKYGELALYKDVKYDPIRYLGRKFLLTGTAELSDYFNYDYRDFEVVYFCICVTPDGGSFSDRWYIYCDRYKYAELLEELKSGSKHMMLICNSYFPDSLKEEMADLVEYCY
ncbi:MAG: hypothetical protein K2J77_07980 [Oscillospiraceae bacterium]|nr:hypothetical protein [Oscillospiraceae bacterium]